MLSIFAEKKNFKNMEISGKKDSFERFFIGKIGESYQKYSLWLFLCKQMETFVWVFNYMSEKEHNWNWIGIFVIFHFH